MAEKARVTAQTPEERQAVATVYATRDVFGEIEQLTAMIKDDRRPPAERNEAKHALAHASERLCNLMSLAVYQLENNTHGPLQEVLRRDLDALRDKLLGLGSKLMVEKLQRIDKRANEVLEDQDYPLGLAGKLDLAFANVKANLRVLGGAERLGEQVPELMSKTETSIKTLGQIEQKLGVMVEVPKVKPRRV